MSGKVMLSFDVEEFDFPRERGVKISLEEGMKVSEQGLRQVMRVLSETGVKATFFCTGNFAKARPEVLRKMIHDGHEVACHGVDHFAPHEDDVARSKEIIEEIIGRKVYGYRQPRMFKIDYGEMERCGYLYDSSVNPAFIPGRYNNLKVSRKPFYRGNIIEVPVSVATRVRVPMFWLALHLYPLKLYLRLAKRIARTQGYFTTYFHPWEFAKIISRKEVPWYIKRNSGEKLAWRLSRLISELKKHDCEYVTYYDYVKEWRKNEATK